MTGFSNYYARAVANHFFRGDVESSAQSRPSELFLSLHSSDPTDDGDNNEELEGGSYSRKFSDHIYISAATPTSIILNNGDSLSIPEGYLKIYIQ